MAGGCTRDHDLDGMVVAADAVHAFDIMLLTIETPTSEDRVSVLIEASRIVVVGPERAAAPPISA